MGFTEEYSKVQPERVCGDHNVRYRGVCPVCVDRLDPNAPWMPGTLYAQKTPSGDVRRLPKAQLEIGGGEWCEMEACVASWSSGCGPIQRVRGFQDHPAVRYRCRRQEGRA